MTDVLRSNSGFPTRCFTWHSIPAKDTLAVSRTFCITWPQRPIFPWRPEPGPDLGIRIEGVDPQVLDELQLVDTMTSLSHELGPRFATAFQSLAEERLADIEKRLPPGLTLQATHR